MDVRAESTMLATVLCASSEMVMAAFGGASVTVTLVPGGINYESATTRADAAGLAMFQLLHLL